MKPVDKRDPKLHTAMVRVREASGLLTKINTGKGVDEFTLARDKQMIPQVNIKRNVGFSSVSV